MQNNKPDYTIDQIIDAVLYYGDLTPKEAKTALVELIEYVIGESWQERGVSVKGIASIDAAQDQLVVKQRQRLKEVTGLSAQNSCIHEWIDATNERVSNTELCLKCYSVRPIVKKEADAQ